MKLYNDIQPEKVTMTLFKAADGNYYRDEQHARYASCTHKRCDTCGEYYGKNSYCRTCYTKRRQDYYESCDIVEWNGETPIVSFDTDHYFWDEEDLEYYLDENEVEPEDLQLMLCEQNYLKEIDLDWFWGDDIPEDIDGVDDLNIDPIIFDKVRELNELIRKQNPISWSQGNKRVRL